tara:strand:+ start:363 stop:914 length:552 start_codon:yes stop_codon:yes gene_type:complete
MSISLGLLNWEAALDYPQWMKLLNPHYVKSKTLSAAREILWEQEFNHYDEKGYETRILLEPMIEQLLKRGQIPSQTEEIGGSIIPKRWRPDKQRPKWIHGRQMMQSYVFPFHVFYHDPRNDSYEDITPRGTVQLEKTAKELFKDIDKEKIHYQGLEDGTYYRMMITLTPEDLDKWFGLWRDEA